MKVNCYKLAFERKYAAWLNKDFRIYDKGNDEETPSTSGLHKTPSRGRPTKHFIGSSAKTKKRRLETILKEHTPEELTFAASTSLRSVGKKDAAMMITEVTSSPTRGTKVKKAYHMKSQTAIKKISPERALSLYIENKMTKKQYCAIRLINKEHNADIYPAYKHILDAKTHCYPDDITITEKYGEIKLQSLLNHTAQRLVSVQSEVLEHVMASETLKNITITYKWGCDGSSGHSKYKQIQTERYDDSFMFVISIVPLHMVAHKQDNTELILWQNPTASSTSHCRPLKIMFEQETAELTRTEVDKINFQITTLQPTNINFLGQNLSIDAKLLLTMVDGKVCNSLSENTSAAVCYICRATPKEMNNLDIISKKKIKSESLSFGISPLHAWIRSLECLLNIAYRLPIKCWQVHKKDKIKIEQRKKDIQTELRETLGLLVDIPKPGSGTTNDGNTARRFFENPEIVSNITGLNQNIIYRFSVILKTIASGFAVNPEAFELYTKDTAKLYIEHYNWYYMPATVHKILIHGTIIISSALLPIGMLSEEAQEARNKDLRKYREHHARKFSRKQNMEDVLHMLLLSSDPVISSHRKPAERKKRSLPKDVLNLLQAPEILAETGTVSRKDGDDIDEDDDDDIDEEDDDYDDDTDTDEDTDTD